VLYVGLESAIIKRKRYSLKKEKEERKKGEGEKG